MFILPIVTLFTLLFLPWFYSDTLISTFHTISQPQHKPALLDQGHDHISNQYVEQEVVLLPAVAAHKNKDLLREVKNSIETFFQELDINDPTTQKTIFTVLLLVLLVISILRWIAFTQDTEGSTPTEQTQTIHIDIPPSELLDVCSISSKALVEESQILDSYSANHLETAEEITSSQFIGSSTPDSFERHETIIDLTSSEKQSIFTPSLGSLSNESKYTTQLKSITTKSSSHTLGMTSERMSPTKSFFPTTNDAMSDNGPQTPLSPTSVISVQLPMASSNGFDYHYTDSPTKLIFQTSNLSVLESKERYHAKTTTNISSGGLSTSGISVGDVTQETVYSTNSSNSTPRINEFDVSEVIRGVVEGHGPDTKESNNSDEQNHDDEKQ